MLIKGLLHILSSPTRLLEIIREELEQVIAEFGDARQTEITAASHDISMEDLITEEDVVVTLSHVVMPNINLWMNTKRNVAGAKAKAATKVKDEDFVERLLIANTHDTILCFSNLGRVLVESLSTALGQPYRTWSPHH